jgi:signal transduction histidine kinase
VDYRFVEVNPAFERLTGIAAAAGRSVRALIPDHEPYWFEIFGRIALTGQPERFERPAESLGGWYDMYAFRVGDPAERRVAVLFSDILDRKRAEAERDTLRARLVQAEDDERRRLARELHDEASQHLTSLGLGLKALSDVAPPGSEIDQRADELRALVDSLGKELHAVAVRLRPRALDDFGLEAALRSYVEDWARQSGVAVDVHTAQDSTRLPGLVESTIYRIVQEALTNVLRHAEATLVSVVLERHDGQVVVVVEDDGKGFDIADIVDNPTLPGLGLRGIRERAALLRGTAEIESHVGGGTSIYARIPIAELGSSMDLPSRRNPSRVRGDG